MIIMIGDLCPLMQLFEVGRFDVLLFQELLSLHSHKDATYGSNNATTASNGLGLSFLRVIGLLQ